MILRLLLILSSAAFLSCGQKAESGAGDLELTFRNKAPFLIPSPTVSCTALFLASAAGETPIADIMDMYFTLSRPELSWKNTERDLTIAMMRIRVNSTALAEEYDCGIYEDELSAIFATGSSAWNREILRATKTGEEVVPTTKKHSDMCPFIKCGGLQPLSATRATMNATVELIGFATDDEGDEFPVRAKTTFKIQYEP